MAMVLTPILKSSLSEKLNNSSSNSRVTFNLPDEENCIMDYLKNEEIPHSTKLNVIIRRLSAADTEDSVLLKWISDFKDNVLFLENNEKIVSSLLNLNWYSKDKKFVSTYQDFILNLVTAHPSFIQPVLLMLIQIFYTVQDSIDEEITEAEARYFQNSHKLLQKIIQLVPLSEKCLLFLLDKKFPYMKNSTKVLHCYIKNLLHLSSYFPSKRSSILECIMEQIIHIDLHCSRDTIEMYETKKAENEDKLLMVQDLNSDLSNEKRSMAYPLAHTLDVILDCIFQYIKKTCFLADGKSLDWYATRKLYKELLTAFDKFVLPTHGCCHLQYIMFYICSFKQELSDGFLDYLWKKVHNPNFPPVYRQLASFYIGSYLARAKYINICTVIACLELLCSWINSYIDNHATQDLHVHGTFHSVCQTVFYVFAFRSQELIEKDKDKRYLRNLNFERIITCRLNPLRYCERDIVQNFANISRNFQVVYVYHVIERNNRNLLYLNHQANTEYCAGAMIQTFFPFDPYILVRSKHWVESLYRIYNHCHKDEEIMDTIDEDETNLSDSLFTYGTSPGFKKTYLSRR